MKNRRMLMVVCFLFLANFLSAQAVWQTITTVEEVCKVYPEQMKSIFQNLNLGYPGLEEVKKAYENNNIPLACNNLLDYYGKSKHETKEPLPAEQKAITEADAILLDIYTFQNVSGKVPHLTDRHLNWSCTGPEKDIEWAWALNRHYPVPPVMEAYFKTGHPKYARFIDLFIKDWIISSWPYPQVRSSTAMWRGLEVSFRVKIWSKVFFGLMQTKLISPATQLLILSSLPQHAHYARNFHAQGNWLTMEISGLATVASSWPEFKEAPSWMNYAIETMVASMKEQIYPDGVQTELTSSYHLVALDNFNLLAEICKKANVSLPEYYTKTLEGMWNYLASIMRPDGFGVLNNDADLISNRERMIKVAAIYGREDWKYIASNGQTGTHPQSSFSYVFPWAGQLISRSDFGTDAQWSFFDMGPWGSGHQHNDKLHLSIYAWGRDLLVDAGRFAYKGETAAKFRKYAVGSQGHNVILVDGKGQAAGPKLAEAPLSENQVRITKDYDFGLGTFDKYIGVEGKFSHTRACFFVRGKFWIIADQIITDRPHKIEALWHWHPDCMVQEDKNGVVSTNNQRGNLKIIPAGLADWKIRVVKGQEKPEIQGWYSKEYNTFEPNTTTIYSSQINSDKTFVWILWPSEGSAPAVRAAIIHQDANSVKVSVSAPDKKQWEILIPFTGSADAEMKML